MEPFVWTPSEDFVRQTNLFQLMQERGVSTYEDVHRWSFEQPEAFWSRTLKRLNIRFQKPFQKIVDVSRGATDPRWLPGAELNIAESCFHGMENRTAIVTRRHNGVEEVITEGELNRMSNRVANGLCAMGLQKGDAVAIDMPMTAEAVMAYLGIIKAGMTVVSVPDSLPPEQVAIRFKIGQAKAVVTQDEVLRAGKRFALYQKIMSIGDEAPRAIVLPLYGEKVTASLRDGDKTWDAFLSDNDVFQAVACQPHDPSNIIFSSGTTGTPKAIPWDHVTPIKAASDSFYHEDIHEGDVLCWPTNLGWMMGPWILYSSQVNKVALAIYEGAPTERGFCEFVQDAKVTMLGLVPSIVVGWRNSAAAEGLDWSSLRCFSSSGEASSPEAYSWLMALNQPKGVLKPVVEYCGGTEIGGAYITCHLTAPLKASTFNAQSMGSCFKVLDSDGQPCASGKTGEVFLVPPALGLSVRLHQGDNDATYYKKSPYPGLRVHGDLMTVGEDGKSWKSNGRSGNDMNLCGIKIGSTEIEQVVNKVEGVLETAAIGVPTPGGGPDRLVIYAVMKQGVFLTEQDRAELKTRMQKAIKTDLNPLFPLYDVVQTEALPRTASNKVMHRCLRDDYEKQPEPMRRSA